MTIPRTSGGWPSLPTFPPFRPISFALPSDVPQKFTGAKPSASSLNAALFRSDRFFRPSPDFFGFLFQSCSSPLRFWSQSTLFFCPVMSSSRSVPRRPWVLGGGSTQIFPLSSDRFSILPSSFLPSGVFFFRRCNCGGFASCFTPSVRSLHVQTYWLTDTSPVRSTNSRGIS